MLKIFLIAGILVISVNFLLRSTRFTSGQTASCALQSAGDINCNGTIGLEDFEIWRKGYFGQPVTTVSPSGILTPLPTSATGAPAPTIGQSLRPPSGASPSSEVIVDYATIPMPAQTAVNQQYPTKTVNEVKKETYSNGAIAYAIELDINGNIVDVLVLPDGTFL